MDKIIVIEGLGADYVSPLLPVHIDPNEWRRGRCPMCCAEQTYRKKQQQQKQQQKKTIGLL